ncbi:Permease of the major facilitator superfamily [Ceraceosorus bombacis]|uniref:Permease of the major facilitator superfamily n=1 Tax=Ceraceosorus bombacis TaxID=401625 RepID=A0A0P1BB28_9BASI|nr:Permease of the major facilitator superfamily [Ceraceosorus bombacis]
MDTVQVLPRAQRASIDSKSSKKTSDLVTKTSDLDALSQSEKSVAAGPSIAKQLEGQGEVQLDYSGFAQKTDPKEKALVRKMDVRIMISLWSLYILNYLDRNAIALARLNDLEEDLGMTDTQYQLAVSILFIGYVLFGIPSNMIVSRMKKNVPTFMVGTMMLWAVLSICTAFVKNAAGLYAVRFFLGVVEAPYYPAALFVLSQFYTRTELATRISILYTGNVLATAFAGLIAAAVFEMDGLMGYAGWKWLFIIQGSITGVVALCAWPWLPATPSTTRWLNPEERELAASRMLRDKVDEGPEGTALDGLKQAVKDPRAWVFVLMQTLHLAANGFKNFFPSVVQTLGFGRTITLVLTCPPYLIAAAVSVAFSISSGRMNERTWHLTACKTIATIGFVTAAATLNTAGRYVAMIIFCSGTYVANSIILGWASTVCNQTKEKKAVVISMMVSASNASFIYTPFLFRDQDKPRYALAMGAMAGFSILCAATAWSMKFILIKQNRTLDATTRYPY